MPENKKVETTALFGLALQLVFLGIAWALYSKSDSRAVLAQMWFLAPGALLWLIVLLHGRQRRLARREREEMEELAKTRMSEEIFEEQELDRMRAHSGLVIFERYVMPVFSVAFGGVLLFLAYRSLGDLVRTAFGAEAEMGRVVPAKDPLAVVAGMTAMAFFGFLLGKYCVGLARQEAAGGVGKGGIPSSSLPLLRAPGSYLMGNVVGSLLLVLAMSMVHFQVLWLEKAAAFAIPALMGMIGVEVLLNMVLNIYRPRVPGRLARVPYDSRLLGLIAEPEDVLKTVAATLDYQFGFKISETWFYRFMARAIVPLILIQLTALWLLSCIVVVHRGEIVFIERFGCPRRPEASSQVGNAGSPVAKAAVYGPGYHLKAPWPIEVARKVPADRIYRKEVGKIFHTDESPFGDKMPPLPKDMQMMTDEDIILWRELHVHPAVGKEADFLVPSVAEIQEEFKAPALNIARVMAHVHFRIKRSAAGGKGDRTVSPAAAYDFYYRHADPERLVEDLSFRAMCRLAASQDFLKWIHVDRAIVSHRFAAMLQKALDENNLGLELVYAGIPAVHPPAETAEPFEDVINAYQEKQTIKHQARQTATRRVNLAKGMAAEVAGRAQSYGHRLKVVSRAESDRFAIQLAAYRKAPDVYRYRKYFSAVEEVLGGHRIFIVPILKDEVLFIDLKESLSDALMNIDLQTR